MVIVERKKTPLLEKVLQHHKCLIDQDIKNKELITVCCEWFS